MRSFIIFVLLSSICFADDPYIPQISRIRTMQEVDRSKFEEYKYRRYSRWRDAIDIRREMNKDKVHRYWTAIRVYPTYYRYNYYPSRDTYRTVEQYRLQEIYSHNYGY